MQSQASSTHPNATVLVRTMASDLKSLSSGATLPQGEEAAILDSTIAAAPGKKPRAHLATILLILLVVGAAGYFFVYPYIVKLMSSEVSVQ